MSWRSERSTPVRVPLVLVPIAVYLGVALIAPALRGAARNEAFREHAAITLAVTAVIVLGWLAVARSSVSPHTAPSGNLFRRRWLRRGGSAPPRLSGMGPHGSEGRHTGPQV